MKKLLLLILLLDLCSFVEGQAQSQTPSRKRPKFSAHSKRAQFTMPPHLAAERRWLWESENEGTGMAPNDPLDRLYPPHKRPLAQMPTPLKIGTSQILSGDVQAAWVARHDEPGSSYDTARDMAVDAAGNIYITGSSGTVKYNSAGIQEWVAANQSGYGYALAADGAGNVYVREFGGPVKYNSAGIQEWGRTYNWSYVGSSSALAVDGAGNVYVTGSSDRYDYALIKYNSAGTQQWMATYNGSGNRDDRGEALAVDGIGNVYVTGSSWNGTTRDYATIKYNSAGIQEWVATYNGPKNIHDDAVALAVDGAGNVYVTGNSGTIKYNSAGTQEWVAGRPGIALAVDDIGNVYVTGNMGTIKYNSTGIKQWVKDGSGVALAVDNAGNVYVTEGSGIDYTTVKYNSAGTQKWIKTYNGPGNYIDTPVALAVDGAGNVCVTGSSDGLATRSDYATVKYDAFGEEQWIARYDKSGLADDVASAMVIDDSGNLYVTGYSYSRADVFPYADSRSYYVYATVKYDATGVQQWVARHIAPGNLPGYAPDLAVDDAGNVYVAGYSEGYTGLRRHYDYSIVKYNSAGTQQWVATYDGPENDDDHLSAVAVDDAGNVYVTGTSWDAGQESYDYATVKYNSAGDQVWVKIYDNGWGNVDDDEVDEDDDGEDQHDPALAVDNAGNIYVTGSSWNGTSFDYETVKYNSGGNEEWRAHYNGPRNNEDYPVALVVDGAGNVYVTGNNWDVDQGSYDCVTVKYNSAGTRQWAVTYQDYSFALVVDGTGNIYLTGSRGTIKYNYAGTQEWITDRPGSVLAVDAASNVYVTGSSWYQQNDYTTVKYNSAGTQEWVATYNGPGNGFDMARALAVDGTGNVYVAGSSYGGTNTGFDYATIKYIQIPIADAGPDKQICSGGSTQIGGNPTGSGGHGGPYTFSWTPTTGLDNPTAPNPIASPAQTTTYTVTVTEIATSLSATDAVTVTVPTTGWSVAHIVDVDDVIFGIDQGAISKPAPRDNRGLALSHDERFLYLGYSMSFNKRVVRKIDLSVNDPANNHSAVVAQLQLPLGSQPARDIATDDRGRVYLALGTKIEVYNSNLQTPPLHTISGFTACEGVAVRRENGTLAVYATERLDKTLKRFVLVEGTGETIASSSKAGLDGDGEVLIVGGSRPRGLDIAGDGTAWIADLGKNRIYRVNSAGKTVDSTGVKSPMDAAIDESRGEVYVSQYTLRTIKVLSLSTGKIKRTLTPPAADLNIDLDGETGMGALCGLDVASCKRVYVANEQGRSLLTGNPLDSPFSNIGDNNDVKAADTDPVLVVTGSGLAKESEVEESEVAKSEVVTSYELAQNYPNPFSPPERGFAGNPSTKIRFALPERGKVTVSIYNEIGQHVRTLVDHEMAAGRHTVHWDGRDQLSQTVAAGMYLYRINVRGNNGSAIFTHSRRMTLLK